MLSTRSSRRTTTRQYGDGTVRGKLARSIFDEDIWDGSIAWKESSQERFVVIGASM